MTEVLNGMIPAAGWQYQSLYITPVYPEYSPQSNSNNTAPLKALVPFSSFVLDIFLVMVRPEISDIACSVAVKLMDLDPQGRWFDPWCGQDKICTAVGPLSKALNPTLLQGVCLLLSLINCKSLWIKAPNFEKLDKHESLEATNRFDPNTRGAVSFFYQILHDSSLINTTKVKQAWADGLNVELEDEVWDECLGSIHDCSVNVRHNLYSLRCCTDSIIPGENCAAFIPMFHLCVIDVNQQSVI